MTLQTELSFTVLVSILPMTMSGAVLNPNSSAPKSAATITSKPVRNCPSACKIILKTVQRVKRIFIVLAIESISKMAI